MLVDHHCHLDFPDFAADLDGIVARARAAGVGIDASRSPRASAASTAFSPSPSASAHVFCSVGTHPHYAHEELDVTVEEIVRLAPHPKVVAIGEAGLDYFYDNSPREAQAQGFRKHIAAAQETQLPLVIHAREADGDIAAILEEEMARKRLPGGAALLHGRRRAGAARARPRALRLVLGHPDVQEVRCAARDRRRVPLDRLLVETDAPYLAPGKYRGKRNEPAYVVETAESWRG